MDTFSAHHAPTFRTVRLRAALATGAVAVAGAFGTGYVLAQQLDEPVRATVAASPAAAAPLKQAPEVRGKAADIRMRRIR